MIDNKRQYIQSLWGNKTTSEIVLVLLQLIDNSFYTDVEKDKIRAVLRGILAYTDRNEPLYEHHREYLKKTWDEVWMAQKNSQVKEDILDWLREPPF